VKCSECGKEVDEKEAVALIIDGEKPYFHPHHVKNLSQRILSQVVLTKAFAEVLAIGTGIGGIFYTLKAFAERALVMDTLSAIAAIVALLVGIDHLRYVKEHDLLRRAVTLMGIGNLIAIVILV
jgi:cation transport ATPase